MNGLSLLIPLISLNLCSPLCSLRNSLCSLWLRGNFYLTTKDTKEITKDTKDLKD